MKVALVAINCKYSHTNIAIRYLYHELIKSGYDAVICEFNLNDRQDYILNNLIKLNADVYAFSCYIWNNTKVMQLISSIKKLTDSKILLGGPEVTFNARHLVENNLNIDAIIMGEGEHIIVSAMRLLSGESDSAESMVWRVNDKVHFTPIFGCADMNKLSLPYLPNEDLSNKVLYYESSRGCPYSCKYCLSSATKGLRLRDFALCIEDIKALNEYGAMTVKFVDRTFNADKKRALEIFRYIIKLESNTCFHFEISADILDDATIELLKKAPKGRIQFEIGIQSTNSQTLDEIDRDNDFDLITSNIQALLENDNIHIHLDLIAGLPFENLVSFKHSFNYCFDLHPHKIQLGFLKILKGSVLSNEVEKYGLIYDEAPPYEILQTSSISFMELYKLKEIEQLVDRVYNEGKFNASIACLSDIVNGFELFYQLSEYFKEEGFFDRPVSEELLFDVMYQFGQSLEEDTAYLEECLRYDYLSRKKRGNRPDWMKNEKVIGEEQTQILKSLYPDDKQIHKTLHLEHFTYNIIDRKKEDCIIAFEYKTDRTYVII